MIPGKLATPPDEIGGRITSPPLGACLSPNDTLAAFPLNYRAGTILTEEQLCTKVNLQAAAHYPSGHQRFSTQSANVSIRSRTSPEVGATKGDSLPVNASQSDTAQEKTRAVPLLLVAPAGALIAGIILYLALSPTMPSHIARHVGPDGVGYSSTPLIMAAIFAAAIIPFLIGWALGRGFFRDNHWFQTQKAVVVCFVSLGYGILGVALGTIVSIVGLDQEHVSGNSVAMGMLGFLLLFTAAACTYAALLPRAKPEPPVQHH